MSETSKESYQGITIQADENPTTKDSNEDLVESASTEQSTNESYQRITIQADENPTTKDSNEDLVEIANRNLLVKVKELKQVNTELLSQHCDKLSQLQIYHKSICAEYETKAQETAEINKETSRVQCASSLYLENKLSDADKQQAPDIAEHLNTSFEFTKEINKLNSLIGNKFERVDAKLNKIQTSALGSSQMETIFALTPTQSPVISRLALEINPRHVQDECQRIELEIF